MACPLALAPPAPPLPRRSELEAFRYSRRHGLATMVRWSVSAFLLRTPGGDPHRSRRTVAQATPHLPTEPAPQKRNQVTGRYKPVAFTRNAAVPKHSAVDLLERCVRLAHATRRTSRFPHAFTYFRSVATDGECLPVASARSRRAMAAAVSHSPRHLRLSKTGLMSGFQ